MRGSPLYAGKTNTPHKSEGINVLNEALKEVSRVIKAHNGQF